MNLSKVKNIFFVGICCLNWTLTSLGQAMPPKRVEQKAAEEADKAKEKQVSSCQAASAADPSADGRRIFGLDDLWPDSWSREKKQTAFDLLKIKPNCLDQELPGKSYGITYGAQASWVLLTLSVLKQIKADGPVFCGDWGGGVGHATLALTMAGAHVHYIDVVAETAKRAIKVAMEAKAFLEPGFHVKDVTQFVRGSVVNPPEAFKSRKNHLNMAFHILHYLAPEDADTFLGHLYENTLPGGKAIVAVNAPDMRDPVEVSYYIKRRDQGELYPGYGVYTKSDCVLTETESLASPIVGRSLMTRAIHEITPEEQGNKSYPMGTKIPGILREGEGQNPEIIPTYIAKGTSREHPRNILALENAHYHYNSSHFAFNPIDHVTLRKALERSGFKVIDTFYTMGDQAPMYPFSVAIERSKKRETFVAGIVVMVAQKP